MENSTIKTVLSELVKAAHANAREKGFYEPVDPEYLLASLRLLLIVSEVSEVMEAIRKGLNTEGEEIADVMIRLLDYAGHRGIDLGTEVLAKMAKNKARPHKHGHRF